MNSTDDTIPDPLPVENKLPDPEFTRDYNLPDPACLSKFAWSTIHFSVGRAMSCCKVAGDKITPETYDTFHNTPSKIRDRELMFQGKWPDTNGPYPLEAHSGCEVCKAVENAGGFSERHLINNNHKLHRLVPKEFKTNPRPLYTSPTILDVYFGNQCNLACIYCSPTCSSTIAAEEHRFADPNATAQIQEVSLTRKTYDKLLEAHWKWMKENAHSLRRYHILGGEPFFQNELQQNLDFFLENNLPELDLVVFSNLKVEKEKLRTILDKFSSLVSDKKVKSVSLFCSFDCWGPQIEFIRHGLNLKQWEENFTIVLKEYPEIDLCIHSTLTCLTFDTFPELCKKFEEWIKIRRVEHSIQTVDGRPFLHPGIFSKGFFDKSINEAINSYQNVIEFLDKSDQKNKITTIGAFKDVITVLKSYQKTFDSHPLDTKNILKLKEFLDVKDFRRKTNWKELWPWLANYTV